MPRRASGLDVLHANVSTVEEAVAVHEPKLHHVPLGRGSQGITAVRPSIRRGALAFLVVLERATVLWPCKGFASGSVENNIERRGAPRDTKVRIAGIAVFTYVDAHARLRVVGIEPIVRVHVRIVFTLANGLFIGTQTSLRGGLRRHAQR